METNMSEALSRIEADIISAMKSGNKTRLDILRMLVNRIKMTAKNDKNRAVVDGDIITAALKTVKEANETRDIYLTRNVDTSAQDDEIAIVSEYLPKQMDEGELQGLIDQIVANVGSSVKGKALMGPIMKELNGKYKGQFDPKLANAIVSKIIV